MTTVSLAVAILCVLVALGALRDAILLTMERRPSWRRWVDFFSGVLIAWWVWGGGM